MYDDLLAVITRLRRATINRDVVLVCDELEKRLAQPVVLPKASGGQFDKKSYQREYMRKRRAKIKVS